jgi:regulator of RNase E activity RraA
VSDAPDERERRRLLDRFDGLRVADVSDALTYLGRDVHARYLLDREIRPAFRDPGNAHQTVGLAATVRYRATGEPATPRGPEATAGRFDPGALWFDDFFPMGYLDDLRPGDLAVVEIEHRPPVGFVGSRLTSMLAEAGATGLLTNAGCRDVDDVADQGFPVYCPYVGPHPRRVAEEEAGVPVSVGGCPVEPGDVVVADADGVVVVPTDLAEEVAEVARAVLADDKGTIEGEETE